MLIGTDRMRAELAAGISAGLVVDILAASLILVALSGHNVVPIMLLVNVGVARAAAAASRVLLRHARGDRRDRAGVLRELRRQRQRHRACSKPGLLAVANFAVAALCFYLGGHMRATEALAAQRGVDLLNLEQVNELIIQRMKTGVLLVDQANHILRINEAAWHLIGNPSPNQRELGTIAPELSRRLYHWRHSGKIDQTAVALAADVPEVIPRFTRLAPNDDANVLIFLDDTSLLSRRAEELTLSSLGRLSASIAHEIRNPLAAIRYSAQLLAESPKLEPEDKRLVDIVNNHCTRANDVIENILQLSRRERSRPETLDLNAWVLAFVEDYKQAQRPRRRSAACRHAEPAHRGDGRSAASAAGRVEPGAERAALRPPAERAGARDGGGAARHRQGPADDRGGRSRPRHPAEGRRRRSSSRSSRPTNTAPALAFTSPSR